MCNRCSGWVHSKCSGLQNAAEYQRLKNGACIYLGSKHCNHFYHQITIKSTDGNPFIIMKFNANGIVNKQVEQGEILERHKVKVAVIQESKRTLMYWTPNIQNFTTVRKDRHQHQGGGLLTLIHKSINFSRSPESHATLADPHL